MPNSEVEISQVTSEREDIHEPLPPLGDDIPSNQRVPNFQSGGPTYYVGLGEISQAIDSPQLHAEIFIHRLPMEILQEIFLNAMIISTHHGAWDTNSGWWKGRRFLHLSSQPYYEFFPCCHQGPSVWKFNEVPWSTSHVCRRWRTTALSTPNLWSYIQICVSHDWANPSDSMLSLLKMTLERSKTQGLDLVINSCSDRSRLSLPISILDLLIEHIDRWERLYSHMVVFDWKRARLLISGGNEEDPSLDDPVLTFPRLKAVALSDRDHEPFLTKFNCPQLETWYNLLRPEQGNPRTIERTSNLLNYYCTLRARQERYHLTRGLEQIAEMKSLKTLRIGLDDDIDPASIPTGLGMWMDPWGLAITFPSVVTLILGSYTPPSQHRFTDMIRVPSLKNLQMASWDKTHHTDPLVILFERSKCSLVSFRGDKVSLSNEEILNALKYTSESLEELLLDFHVEPGLSETRWPMESLTTGVTSDEFVQSLLEYPKLRSLSLVTVTQINLDSMLHWLEARFPLTSEPSTELVIPPLRSIELNVLDHNENKLTEYQKETIRSSRVRHGLNIEIGTWGWSSDDTFSDGLEEESGSYVHYYEF